MSEKYSFNDGKWNYTFSFYKYATIHVTMYKNSGIGWHDWFVWYNDNGCNWTNAYGACKMSEAAKKFGDKLVKMRLFL